MHIRTVNQEQAHTRTLRPEVQPLTYYPFINYTIFNIAFSETLYFFFKVCRAVFRCLNILKEAGKEEILQQMFRKFQISNRLPDRYFPKIDVGCPCSLVKTKTPHPARTERLLKNTKRHSKTPNLPRLSTRFRVQCLDAIDSRKFYYSGFSQSGEASFGKMSALTF